MSPRNLPAFRPIETHRYVMLNNGVIWEGDDKPPLLRLMKEYEAHWGCCHIFDNGIYYFLQSNARGVKSRAIPDEYK